MAKLKYKKRRPYRRTESPKQIYTEMTTHHVDVLRISNLRLSPPAISTKASTTRPSRKP
ncbi:MAG: hypothetical protein LLF76_00080 [Planctomycetaceae bacterium]|nr:hypothetical protein [Planctomycetaceae bacterium]